MRLKQLAAAAAKTFLCTIDKDAWENLDRVCKYMGTQIKRHVIIQKRRYLFRIGKKMRLVSVPENQPYLETFQNLVKANKGKQVSWIQNED